MHFCTNLSHSGGVNVVSSKEYILYHIISMSYIVIISHGSQSREERMGGRQRRGRERETAGSTGGFRECWQSPGCEERGCVERERVCVRVCVLAGSGL